MTKKVEDCWRIVKAMGFLAFLGIKYVWWEL